MRAGIAQSAEIAIWPENAQALKVFAALGTQWRVGMSGPTGLDYAAIPPVLDLLDVKPEQRGELFAALRLMEQEALGAYRDGRQQDQHRHHR